MRAFFAIIIVGVKTKPETKPIPARLEIATKMFPDQNIEEPASEAIPPITPPATVVNAVVIRVGIPIFFATQALFLFIFLSFGLLSPKVYFSTIFSAFLTFNVTRSINAVATISCNTPAFEWSRESSIIESLS